MEGETTMNRESELTAIYVAIEDALNKGQHNVVIELTDQLLKKAELYGVDKVILSAHNISAISYYYMGNLEKVLFHVEKHHDLCLLNGTRFDWMYSYYLQYLVSQFASDHERGERLLKDMLSIALELNDHSNITVAYGKLSHLYNKKGCFEQALEYAKSGLRYAETEEVDRELFLIQAHLFLVESAINLKDAELALKSIHYVSELSSLSSCPREKVFYKILKARVHELLDEPENAFYYYTMVVENEELVNDYESLKEIQQKRIALAEKICDFDELAIIQKEYIDLLHNLEDRTFAKEALELQIRLQSSSAITKENMDYLTGVFNRKYLEETTDLWLHEALETKSRVVCIAFDIDNLKAINDTYGHLIGDKAIKFVANICMSDIRKDDLLARFGGDEFVLVMRDISLEQAERKASLLAKKIEELSQTTVELPTQVTISVGLGDNTIRDVHNFKDLFHLADLALYKAKKNGKNQVVSFA